MPVTLPAHAAAILPFTRLRSLHATALVVGTTAPDMAYLIGKYGAFLHTPQGILLGCVPLGLFGFVWAEALLLPTLRATIPSWGGVQWARFAASRGVPTTILGWIWAAFSVALGAATHVLWDGFTHRKQWPASALYPDVFVDWTGEPMRLSHFLQWASSVAGTLLVAIFLISRYTKLPRIQGGSFTELAKILLPACAAASIGGALRLPSGELWLTFWGAASGGFLGLTAACLLHQAPRMAGVMESGEPGS